MTARKADMTWRGLAILGLLMPAIAFPSQTAESSSNTTTFTILVQFDGSNGADPQSAADLIQGADGELYGTTFEGGKYDSGTVFKLTSKGTLTNVYDFCSQPNCVDGTRPVAGLVVGKDKNFYGVTSAGGANFYGTVFKMTPCGKLTTLYSFCSEANCADGSFPSAALIQASDGNLYGTTENGGNTGCGGIGCGTVFMITPSGKLTTLHIFNETDGGIPVGALIQGADESFYGITYLGGSHNEGTVFKMTPAGTLTTLHNFSGDDGAQPAAGLTKGEDGNLYGTTSEGGCYGDGAVFRITPNGKLTKLHSFRGSDGDYPLAALIQATDGNFYGTTAEGGTHGFGTIFKMAQAGTLTVLYDFDSIEGFGNSALTQATNGTFYGTTYPDNSAEDGTVFSFRDGDDAAR